MSEQIVSVGDHQIGLELEDGDVITDVVVLARVQRLDSPGESSLVIGSSESTDYIVQTGMLSVAVGIVEDEG